MANVGKSTCERLRESFAPGNQRLYRLLADTAADAPREEPPFPRFDDPCADAHGQPLIQGPGSKGKRRGVKRKPSGGGGEGGDAGLQRRRVKTRDSRPDSSKTGLIGAP